MIILTDLSEVLVRGVYGVEDLVDIYYGEEIRERFLERRQETNPFFCELMRGHMDENTFWKIFMEHYEWPFTVAEIKKLLTMNFFITIPDTLEVYERIVSYPCTTDYNAKIVDGRPDIWIVSDHIYERRDEIKNLHPEVFELSQHEIWSYQCGILKSDAGFFQHLLYATKLRPEEVIFVDDYSKNVYAARNAGIESILFSDAKRLEEELRELGFRFGTRFRETEMC